MPPRPLGRLAALLIALCFFSFTAGCAPAGEPTEQRPGASGKVPGTASTSTSGEKVPGTFADGSVEVRYLANEGVLLTVLGPEGELGPRVLIDGLFRPAVPGYPVLPEAHRELLETAAEPYAGIDLILATHLHGDHFSPEAVARYLTAEPEARFLSAPRAVERLLALPGADAFRDRVEAVLPEPGERIERRYEMPGLREGAGEGARDLPALPKSSREAIAVAVYELDHGPGTNAQNLGFIVELAGRRFLHVGDTEVAPEAIVALGLEHPRIHAAFLPYWLLLRRSGEAWLDAVSADLVAAVHWPAPDAPRSYFEPGGSLGEIRNAIRERYPEVILPPVEPSAPEAAEGILLRLGTAGVPQGSGEKSSAEEETLAFLREEVAREPLRRSARLVLATTLAQLGRKEAALTELRRLDEAGLDLPLDPVDFASLADDPELGRLARNIASRAPRTAAPDLLHTLTERDLAPEGTAYDPATGDLFVSSITRRKVVRLAKDGSVSDFVRSGQDRLLGVLGMEVDSARNLLWVASVAVGRPAMDGYTDELRGRSALHAFRLDDGGTELALHLGSSEEVAVLNDLTVLPDGVVVVTDSARGAVYELDPRAEARGGEAVLRPLLAPGSLKAPNGIAASEDGRQIYVASFRGITVVERATGEAVLLDSSRAKAPAGLLELAGIDGLYQHEGDLIALQNLLGLPRLWRVRLDETGTAATAAELLFSALPGGEAVDGTSYPKLWIDGPTTGAVTPEGFVFVGNPQGRRSREDGRMLPAEELRDLAVLRVPLGNRG